MEILKAHTRAGLDSITRRNFSVFKNKYDGRSMLKLNEVILLECLKCMFFRGFSLGGFFCRGSEVTFSLGELQRVLSNYPVPKKVVETAVRRYMVFEMKRASLGHCMQLSLYGIVFLVLRNDFQPFL